MYFIGCSTIHLMTSISIERYYVIKNTLVNGTISDKSKIKIIILCLLSGLFWASMPLIGKLDETKFRLGEWGTFTKEILCNELYFTKLN